MIDIPERYNVDNIKRVARNPSLISNELSRLTIKGASFVYNPFFWREYEKDPVIIADEDWDNLLILDACRYDYFKEKNQIEGTLRSVISGGSESWGFMQHNFSEQQLHDTIYITANPHFERLSDDVFFTVESLLDEWDEEVQTVHPRDIVDRAISVNKEYPNKRLIIHFMQPHTPWLGATANRIRSRLNMRGFNKDPWWKENSDERAIVSGIGWFQAVREGNISQEEMERAYGETLEIALNSAETLVQQLDGKSVITSDHGEMLGERIIPRTRPLYGHYYHELCTPQLRIVPWFEIDCNQRRKIIEQSPIGFEGNKDRVVNSQLEALGYK